MFPNRVSCKALEDTKYREISPLFLGATFVTYSKEAKVKPLLSAIKKQPKVELLGAKIDEQLLSRKSVVDYSKLPSLTELHGQLIQMLSEPSRRLSMLLGQNQTNLSGNLSQYVSQGADKSWYAKTLMCTYCQKSIVGINFVTMCIFNICYNLYQKHLKHSEFILWATIPTSSLLPLLLAIENETYCDLCHCRF